MLPISRKLQAAGLDSDKWKKVAAILMIFGVSEEELQINKDGITIERQFSQQPDGIGTP